MDRKKGIIAIVLFVFVGLMVFSFANPSDGITELEDKTKVSANQLANTVSDDAPATLTSITEENGEDNTNTLTIVQSTGNNDSSNNYSTIIPSTEDNDGTQNEDYSSIIAMVEKIEVQVKSAQTLNDARKDYESVKSAVESVNDKNIQKTLDERLKAVSIIINDTTAPKILLNGEEVERDSFYNGNVVITVEDSNTTKTKLIKLNDKEIDNVDELIDGVYEITVIDAAFNETMVTFTYDNTAPKPHSTTYSISEPTNQPVVVTIKVSEELREVEGWTLSEDKKSISKSFNDNVNGNVVISDLAGNEAKRYYSIKNIDKKNPSATVTYSNTDENGKLYSTNKDVTVTLISEEKIKPIDGWVEIELGYKYSFTHSQSGKYSIEIADLAGNVSVIKYEVKRLDKVAPELTIIPNTNRIRHEVNTPFTDPGYNAYDKVDKNVTNLVKVSYKYNNNGNWEKVSELDTSKLGEYVITYTAYDKNGNSTSKTRAVTIQDTTAPVITLPSELGLNKNEMHVESGTKVSLKDVIAEVTDNYDETKKIKPYKAYLLISNIASENDYEYNFENGFDTSYSGRYNIYYKIKDSSGNETTKTLLLVMKDTTAPTIELKGTEGINNNEYRVVQDTVVTLKDVLAKSKDIVDGEKGLEPISIRRYYPIETGKASHKYDASNGFDTSSVGYYEIKFEAKDSSGNKSNKTMLLVVKEKSASLIANESDLKEGLKKGGKYKLTKDIVISANSKEDWLIVPEGVSITIDMNGYNISASDSAVKANKLIVVNGKLIINGNGTWDATNTNYGRSLQAEGNGEIIINNGKYIGQIIQFDNANIYIYNGYFKGTYYDANDYYNSSAYVLNEPWAAGNITVYGGTYEGMNPAWGDEGRAKPGPLYSPTGHCQGVFFEGQTQHSGIPSTYQVIEGMTSDGIPTYTVKYSK